MADEARQARSVPANERNRHRFPAVGLSGPCAAEIAETWAAIISVMTDVTQILSQIEQGDPKSLLFEQIDGGATIAHRSNIKTLRLHYRYNAGQHPFLIVDDQNFSRGSGFHDRST